MAIFKARQGWLPDVALLRCPICLHVLFVADGGSHTCPSCDHGSGATVAPRLPIQSKQDYDDLYYQEASLQLATEAARRTTAPASFGQPNPDKRPSALKAANATGTANASWWARRRTARKQVKATKASKAAVTAAEPAANLATQPDLDLGIVRTPASAAPAQATPAAPAADRKPKPGKAPRPPGTSKRNWFARTSFGTAWGAFVVVAAVALGAIARLEAEAGFSVEDTLGTPLDNAVGWPTIALALLTGVLGIVWARRNPQAKGLVRSVFGIVLAAALAATFFVELGDFVEPILAP